jgi:uncharacterized protein YqjF (DUF2071 family)
MAMRLPVIQGVIKRRLLVNFRVDPAVIRAKLPSPFRPKLHAGQAIAGVCLMRLEGIRPVGMPAFLGISSENAAHRIAVEWDGPDGAKREGVFIPRRDTDSRLNHLAGGRIFPGEHHLSSFTVTDDGERIDFAMASRDGRVSIRLRASATPLFPTGSCFRSFAESSAFFQGGSVGYSATRAGDRLDGLRLETQRWEMAPLAIDVVENTFFSDPAAYPAGSVEFDHALIMRDIEHRWLPEPDLAIGPCPCANLPIGGDVAYSAKPENDNGAAGILPR